MEEDTKKIIKAAVIAGILFSLILDISDSGSGYQYLLSAFIGIFAGGFYKIFGGRLTLRSFVAVVILSVVVAHISGLLISTVHAVLQGESLAGAEFFATLFLLILGTVFWSIINLCIACHIGLHFIADKEERKALIGERTMRILGVVSLIFFFVVVIGFLLWQLGPSPRPQPYSVYGFGPVKPIEHSSSGSSKLEIVFMNAVGSTIDFNVSIGGTTVAGGSIDGGYTETLSLSHPSICPAGADSYDIKMNVTYINRITGLSRTNTGRVRGPC